MSNLQNEIRETLSYKLFLSQEKKHIEEDDLFELRKNILKEAWGECPGTSMNAAMAWTIPKHKALQEVLTKDGIHIHKRDEYEKMFLEWYESQKHDIPKTFPANLKYYSTKRQEFDEIYKKKKEC